MATKFFTRRDLVTIRTELEQALKIVESKLGIAITIGRLSGETDSIRCKLTCNPAETASSPVIESWRPDAATAAEIARTAGAYAAKPAGPTDPALVSAMKRYGVRQMTNNKGDTLIGYHPNRPKYCFEYKSIRGAKWLMSAEQAVKRFGRA